MDENGIIIVRGSDEFTFAYIGSPEGFEFPSTRPVIEDISGPQSSIWITSKFGRRPLSFQFVLSDDVLENRRAVGNICRQGELVLMKFGTCDNLDLQSYVQINKLLMPYKMGRVAGLIEAVAPDWRFYSQTLHTNESAAANQTIENAGNEATNPVFRLKGPFTSVNILNASNSEEFTVTATLTSGQWIEIDTLARTVVRETGASVFSSFVGTFISLLPGDNVLTFDPAGDSGATALVTTWRDAYVGI